MHCPCHPLLERRSGPRDPQAAVERQIQSGVHGLVPCGTTGETPTLSPEEWAAVIQTTVEVNNGRVPVIAGCGSNSTRQTVDNIRAAKALGADAALVVFPYYNKPNAAGLQAHVSAACAEGLPVVLTMYPAEPVSASALPFRAALPHARRCGPQRSHR